uniref:Uncharacterized protein n=1 Tax=Desertifilum tharense IPPAS B-1220 TaxID=1781255 RepID=A0ACD5GW18_9CYAN
MSEPESTVVSLAPVDDVIESAYSPSSDLTAVSDTLIKLTDEGWCISRMLLRFVRQSARRCGVWRK